MSPVASEHCTDAARVRFRGVAEPNPPMRSGALRVVGTVLVHPSLWPTALRQVGRMSRPQWWRRAPFVPIPDADYLRFRLETQYGTDGPPDPGDVLVFLRWCREHDR